jgi:small subunit ribosomal protein S16
MPTKIRLQRYGKKGQPFYHIVIADGRAPRDGRNIEKIGTYNPLTKPAEIVLDFERALHWLQVGAQPTDTVRSLLSYKGVVYKNHLLKGVTKGALTPEQAELKFQEWNEAKLSKIENASKELENKERAQEKQRLDAEAKIKEARLEEFAKRREAEIEKQVQEAREKQAAKAAETAEAEAKTAAEKAPQPEVADNKDNAPAAAEEKAPAADAAENKEAAPEVKEAEEVKEPEEKKEEKK